MMFSLRVPANNDRNPQYIEQVLDVLHTGNISRRVIQLAIARHSDEIMLYCRLRETLSDSTISQIHASYPDAKIETVADYSLRCRVDYHRYSARLHLTPKLGMLRTWQEHTDREQRVLADPLAGILAMVNDETLHVSMTLAVKPYSNRWQNRLRSRTDQHDETVRKLDRLLHRTRLTVHVDAPRGERKKARRKLSQVVAAYGRFNSGRTQLKRCLLPRSFPLSTVELATLWHPATEQVRTPKLASVESRQLEPPTMIPSRKREPEIAVLGRIAFHNQDDVFGIRPDDRLRHLAVIGKTGMGKTTLLLNLIASDIAANRGVFLVDPHGDLADDVLRTIPRSRTNDVVLFDAGDLSHPISFNPMDCHRKEQRPLVAAGLVLSLKKIYGDSWGPRLEYILRNTVLALLETPGTSMMSILRMLSDTAYRKQLVGRLEDPLVRNFWQNEFARWKPQLQAEAVSPIQNKVGQFLSNPILRSILGQSKNRLDLRKIMDDGDILIANLSKGRIGEDGSSLLGSLLVTNLQLAAMSRADQPEADRKEFFAYIDEFQNFSTDSFATILSEARKYRLALTIANQYLDQIDETTRQSVFGNVGTMISFQVGSSDAEIIADQFGGHLTPSDLMALPRFTSYARLLIDGMPSRPFSMQTLPPPEEQEDRLEIIRRASRHRYTQPIKRVIAELEHQFANV